VHACVRACGRACVRACVFFPWHPTCLRKESKTVLPADTCIHAYLYTTLLSISLSHISLIVHPAPRMTTAPRANLESIITSGRWPMGATMAILQQHGHSSSHVPMGLSARASMRYGWYCVGIASTHVIGGRDTCTGTSFPLGMGTRASRGGKIKGPPLPHSDLAHAICVGASRRGRATAHRPFDTWLSEGRPDTAGKDRSVRLLAPNTWGGARNSERMYLCGTFCETLISCRENIYERCILFRKNVSL